MAIGGDGGAVAVFSQSDGAQNRIYARSWNGLAWSVAELIDAGTGGNAACHQVAMGRSGGAVAVCVQRREGVWRAYARHWDGTAWSEAGSIDAGTAYDADSTQIAVDGSGAAIAVFVEMGEDLKHVYANRWGVPPPPAPAPTATPTAAPRDAANCLELRVREAEAGLGGTVTLEWAADPDQIWELTGRPVAIYFGVAQGQGATGRPATVAEALSNERMYLFGTERGVLEASPFDPSHIPPTWGRVVFPLPDGATSGEMAFGVPADASFAGEWVFEAAFVDLGTGEFVNRRYPVEVSNAVRVF